MYHLKKNPVFTRTASLPGVQEVVNDANRRLADSSAGLSFEAAEHRYFLAGKEMRSVSSIVEHFAPFDSLAVATGCSLNPKHEHFGKDPEEIVAIWEQISREAADAGTRVHAFAEACCLYLQGREDEIDEAFRDRVTAEGLAAADAKEEAVARWWAELDWTRYAVVAKETRVVNPLLGYAGTFDLLLYDLLSCAFAQRDYKTNKDLERSFGKMLPPLSMLRDSDMCKYTVQQTAYTIQLRNIGLPINSNQLIWLREDGYREVELDLRYDRVVAWAIEQLLRRDREGAEETYQQNPNK